jgi:ribosomal protein L11 methyltransferase
LRSAAQQYLWSKLASAKWEDAWVERLQVLGPGRLAIFSLPGSRRIRLEAYGLSRREAARITGAFGGQMRKMKASRAAVSTREPPPLLIRDRLVVVRSARTARSAERSYPGRAVLIIPAAMAFGTGDHATTSTCLRLVTDFAASQDARWEALDLGAGTGILALAARLLGASRCDAWDYDPACIRAIRENGRVNGLRNVPAARVDVTAWRPTRQWDLVTANLFSEVLVKTSRQIIRAVKPGGRLILSGMLAAQADDALAVFGARGVAFERVVRRGKWVTAIGRPVKRKRVRMALESGSPAWEQLFDVLPQSKKTPTG